MRTGLPAYVFDRNLALAIGPQILQAAAAAHFRKLLAEAVRHLDRQRHQLGSFVAGIAEHQALIARAAGVHAHRDVGRLALNAVQNAAGLGVEAECRVRVADFGDRLAGDARDVDIGGGCDFAGHDADAGGHQDFAGNAPGGVLRENGVEHGIGNMIGDLIGVTFGNGFGREKMSMFVDFGHGFSGLILRLTNASVPPRRNRGFGQCEDETISISQPLLCMQTAVFASSRGVLDLQRRAGTGSRPLKS